MIIKLRCNVVNFVTFVEVRNGFVTLTRDSNLASQKFKRESQSFAAQLEQERANLGRVIEAERESMLKAVDQERLASAALTAAAAVRSEKLDDEAGALANREADVVRKERSLQDKAGP